MFDAQNHELHPASGLMVHKDTGHLVGIEPAPPVAKPGVAEWPKWITPHDSQIVRQLDADGKPVPGGNVSTPGWENYHVNRLDGGVTVLVNNPDEEKRALGDYKAESPEDQPPVADEKIVRAVNADIARAQQAAAEAAAAEDAKAHAALVAEEAARRTAEKVERDAADAKAAADLAEAQRVRLAEKIGAPVVASSKPEPPPSPVTPPQVLPTATRPIR